MVLASSLYGTALLTTSTILPQMQGAMSATQDEIAWAMTFNILATAIVTPMTGWLVARFGEKRVMVWSIGVFTLATLLCGMAQSLEALVFWRIIQGGTGAPVVPLSQTILLNTFPRRQHQMVLGLFGMAVAVAPVFGPILGGYLAEAYSWRWAFYMLVPVGVAALIGMQLTLRADGPPATARFDWTGFIALSIALAAIQLVLARGVRLDWFNSTEIIARVPDRGGRVLRVHLPLPHHHVAVPEPEAADRPQLRHRPRAGDDLRHAELHPDGAAAAAAAAARRLQRCAGRPGDRRARRRHDGRLPDAPA